LFGSGPLAGREFIFQHTGRRSGTFSEKSTRRPSCGDRLRMQYPATRPLQRAPCGRSIPIFQRAPGQWIAAAAGIAARAKSASATVCDSNSKNAKKNRNPVLFRATIPKIYCGGACGWWSGPGLAWVWEVWLGYSHMGEL
jgi:hypothetical protein